MTSSPSTSRTVATEHEHEAQEDQHVDSLVSRRRPATHPASPARQRRRPNGSRVDRSSRIGAWSRRRQAHRCPRASPCAARRGRRRRRRRRVPRDRRAGARARSAGRRRDRPRAPRTAPRRRRRRRRRRDRGPSNSSSSSVASAERRGRSARRSLGRRGRFGLGLVLGGGSGAGAGMVTGAAGHVDRDRRGRRLQPRRVVEDPLQLGDRPAQAQSLLVDVALEGPDVVA